MLLVNVNTGLSEEGENVRVLLGYGKIFSLHTPWRRIQGVDIWLHTLWTSDRRQLHSPAALSPEKKTPSPTEIKPGWVPQPVGARADFTKIVERRFVQVQMSFFKKAAWVWVQSNFFWL